MRLITGKHDRLFYLALLPSAFAVLTVFTLLVLTLTLNSLPVLTSEGLEFITRPLWRPSEDPREAFYGILVPLVGSIYVGVLSVGMAAPPSILLAFAISEYLRGKVGNLINSLVDAAAGLPSVVFGLWGLTELSPILYKYLLLPLHEYLGFMPLFSCRPISGTSLLTASLILSVMLVPYLTAVIRESYSLIPTTYREAVLALGATQYEYFKVMMSFLKPALVASLLIGFGRAAAETVVVSMLVGNSFNLTPCVLAPTYTISSLIANQFSESGFYPLMSSALFASGLILLTVGIAVNYVGIKLVSRWRGGVIGR